MTVERGDGWELHLADWRSVDIPQVDAVIEDPPYSDRTHAGQKHHGIIDGRAADSLARHGDLNYEALSESDVAELVERGHQVCDRWMLSMTSHDLLQPYELALRAAGRCTFVPVPIVIPGMNVRMGGDGPSNWTVQLVVSRTARKKCWSTKPGCYYGHTDRDRATSPVKGGKPLSLLEAILRDYTEPGDLVLDRFAGGGTTGVAAIRTGRRFFGCERKPEHFAIAVKRLRAAREQLQIFPETTP